MILDRIESLEESLVRARSNSPPEKARLDLAVDLIQKESNSGFAQGIFRE